MLFSILIIVSGMAENIEATVLSAVKQSLGNDRYEIIVIDDASADEVAAKLEALGRQYDHVSVFRNFKRIGLGAAKNRAVMEASGEYLIFLEAGTLLKSDALEAYSIVVAKKHPDIVHADVIEINDYGEQVAMVGGEDGKFQVKAAAYKKLFLNTHRIKFGDCSIFCDLPFAASCVELAARTCLVPVGLYYRGMRVSVSPICDSQEAITHELQSLELFYTRFHNQTHGPNKAEWNREVSRLLYRAGHDIAQSGHVEASALVQYLCDFVKASPVLRAASSNVLSELLSIPVAPPADGIKDAFVSKEDWTRLIEAASDAVVFVSIINGHTRHFTFIARHLQAMGIKSVLIDMAPAVAPPSRRITDQDRVNLADIPYFAFDRSYPCPIVETARAYVFAVDWNYAYDLIFQCKLQQIPTIAFYEGINNDFRTQEAFFFRGLPYRNVDYLLLPGEYYKKIYSKQETVVVGLPALHDLLREPVIFPSQPMALINLNFIKTQDGGDWWPEVFIATAIEACNEVGIPFVASIHPSYTGPREGFPQSEKSFYEDIKQYSFLISKFSTCILESLALGKPIIYHNPHGEKVPKFQEDPMGAYAVTTTKDELVAAIKNVLKDVADGTDFRMKSAVFLQHHGNIFADKAPALSAATALKEIIDHDSVNFQKRLLKYADRGLLMRSPSPVPYPVVSSLAVVMAAHVAGEKTAAATSRFQAYLNARAKALRVASPGSDKSKAQTTTKAQSLPQSRPQLKDSAHHLAESYKKAKWKKKCLALWFLNRSMLKDLLIAKGKNKWAWLVARFIKA
ncbi:MAG: glycosyltransferase family 2 protein [Candidatus Adiutrix sp.]|jgi:hypothetical protein|nr:glycosyltransferase family 2 protein [Candidatus Adiutrix sp.]